MLKLIRRGAEVYTEEGKKLRVIAQATKGPNKEAVNIEGLEGSNGKKWIQLSLLQEGENSIECKATIRESSGYVLTEEEKAQIADLESQIKAIKDAARARYVPASHKSLTSMSIAELEAFIERRKLELGQKA